MVAKEVCEAGVPGVPVWNIPQPVRDVMFRYVTDLEMNKADTEPMHHHISESESIKSSLLLLRGLIACGILNLLCSRSDGA